MSSLKQATSHAGPAIVAALENLRATHGLGALPMLAAPLVLPKKERVRLAGLVEGLHARLLNLVKDSTWPAQVPLDDALGKLVAAEKPGLPVLGSCRFDALYDPDTGNFQAVEVQAGDPSGAAWTDGILAALASVPELAPWCRQGDPLIPSHLAHVLGHLEMPRPRLALVNEDGSFVASDYDLQAHIYRQHGIAAQRVDPRNFQRLDGLLLANGHPVDAIIRDSHEELTLSPGPAATQVLTQALMEGLPRFNPLGDAWFDDKQCFAQLHQGSNPLPCVPETRLVDAGVVLQLRHERDAWVLKPANGYGGFGVVMGNAVSQQQWEDALHTACMTRHVAQRRVEVPLMEVARQEGGQVVWKRQYVTLSLWCHGGRFAGAYARAGDQPVVNVHQGGGIGPVVFADNVTAA